MNNKPKVLVLDDELTIHESISYALRGYEIEIVSATSITEAASQFAQDPKSFVLAFIDHRLKQDDGTVEFGLGVVPILKGLNPNVTPVMISGCEDESVLKSWLDQKINRYLYKPLKIELVRVIFEVELEKWQQLHVSKRSIGERADKILKDFKIIGGSESIVSAVKVAVKAAKSKSQLVTLILGESGTGKELIAKGIHNKSNRSERPFLPINCAAFGSSSALLESELFGHEKGAFTGADKRKVGIFEAACGGTVFLDEVHCLSKKSQEQLLRVIQERKIRRVGSNEEYSIDINLIAASKPNLLEMAKEKEFLPDLYYRLNGFDIQLPPLRERPSDIVILAKYFLAKKNGDSMSKEFDFQVIELFLKHTWPGNVRELETAVERAFEMSDKNVIRVQDLPHNIFEDHTIDMLQGIVPLEILKNDYDEKLKKSIQLALNRTKFNLSLASRLLGVKRSELRSHMRRLNFDEVIKTKQPKIVQL